jgi:beta-lactamase regulating signal transducer with metallopeptidase domain
MMHPLILNLNGAAAIWWRYVFHATWQASLVSIGALALARVFRRWPAPLRAALLLIALLKFLAPPMLPSPVGLFPAAEPIAVSEKHPRAVESVPAAPAPAIAFDDRSFSPKEESVSVANSIAAPRLTLWAWMMLIHAAGSLAVLTAVAIEMKLLRRLGRRAKTLTSGAVYERMIAVAHRLKIRPPRELLLSPDPVSPMAFGILRRRVMLPESVAASLGPEELDAVLAHELAHHRRHDTLANAIQLAAVIAWWFNPLAWMLGRELRRTREECCDDIVLAHGIARGADYCRTIIAAAERLAAPLPFRGELAIAEPMHPLGSRMKRIMDPSLRRSSRLSRMALGAVLILAVVVLPGTRLRGQQQAPKYTVILRVQVESADDGKPIAGATLRIPRDQADFHTDAQGRLTIESLSPGTWRVEAMAPGRAKVTKLLNLSAAGDNTLTFALPAGGRVSGHVTDADGSTIRGVGVNIYVGEDGDPFDYVEPNLSGLYLLDNVPLDQRCRILFHHDGYVNVWKTTELSATHPHDVQNVSLDLKPAGGSVVGTVVDADGKPISGARIIYNIYSNREMTTVKTDARGAFRLDGVDTSMQNIAQAIVRARGWAPKAVDIEQLGTMQAAAQLTVRMTEKGHRITGRLVDEAGEPIRDARVRAGEVRRTINDERTVITTTNVDGVFRFDSLPAPASFDFMANGYTTIRWKELPVDGDDEVTVVMQRQAAIIGRVVDDDTGRPVPDFNVTVRHEQQGQEFSEASGEFHINGLDAGTKTTLVVTADGYPVQYFDNIAATSGVIGAPIVLRLSKHPPDHVRIAGRILDAGGKPIVGVEVRVIAYSPDDSGVPQERRFNWRMLKSGQLRIQDYIRSIEEGRTAADGMFDFPSVPGPDVDLAYWGDGVAQALLQDIALQPADKREHMEIHVPMPATISGRINRQVYPIVTELTLVSAADPQFEMLVRVNDGQDHYAFNDVPLGSYNLLIFGKAIGNEDGTFYFPQIGKDQAAVKEGELRQLDLGFGNGSVPKTHGEP